MTYDQWKTESGYYERDDFDDPPECDHSEYEVDILSGRAECCICPYSWYQTEDEIAAEAEHQREYAKWEARENRREFWRKLTLPIRWPIFRLLERIWPRKSLSVLHDDEIPF